MLQTGAGSRLRSKLAALQAYGGLTFFKDYSLMPTGAVSATTLAADYSIGSAAATFTASRGASNPAMLLDHNGVVSSSVTSNLGRKTAGFYDSTGFVSRPGLIVEGAGTNILPRSDGSSSAGTIWTGWAGLEDVDTGTTAYDNTNTPSISGISGAKTQRLVGSNISVATNRSHYVYYQTAAGSIANATTYTASAWVKINSISGVNVQISVRTLNNPVTAVQETFSSSSLSAVAGWVRIQKTFTTNDVDTSACYFRLDVINIDAGDSYDVEFYAPQLEALPFATTFIPTTTAALTRNAETLTYPITGNRTASTESLFVKFTPFWTSTEPSVVYRLHSTDSKSREVRLDTGTDKLAFFPNATDSGTSASSLTTSIVKGTSYVIGSVAYGATSGTNSEIYLNGASEGSNTTDYTENVFGTNFYVGGLNGFDRAANGIISSIAIFSDAKSAAQVLAISNLLAGA